MAAEQLVDGREEPREEQRDDGRNQDRRQEPDEPQRLQGGQGDDEQKPAVGVEPRDAALDARLRGLVWWR